MIDSFKAVFESEQLSAMLKKNRLSGSQEMDIPKSPMDLISNPMMSLESLLRYKESKSVNEKSQMIRYFDQESRIYLMHLNRQITDYAGDMLSLKDKGYEAPFKVDSLQARRALRGL